MDMIAGINRTLEHGGKTYHVQCEDLGREEAAFEVRVCDHGSILWQKRFSYRDLLSEERPESELDVAVRGQMEKTVITVEAAILKDKLP